MLVTGNGITLLFDDDDWAYDLLSAINAIPDTIDDEVAEHALDTICFLQDADVCTPMDTLVESPLAFGGISAWLEWIG